MKRGATAPSRRAQARSSRSPATGVSAPIAAQISGSPSAPVMAKAAASFTPGSDSSTVSMKRGLTSDPPMSIISRSRPVMVSTCPSLTAPRWPG